MTKSLIDHEALKRIHRDLDACQKVIHLAGGFDPAYCKDAQARLKEIDALLTQPSPAPVQVMRFEYKHPDTGEIRSVVIAREEVLAGMEYELFEKLVEQLCQCEPIGETNVIDCRCDEHAEEFALLSDRPTAHPTTMTLATTDVLTERRRQVEAEGWTREHDDTHGHGQLARAAACYALSGSCAPGDETAAMLVDLAWPWPARWWKPTTSRRDLVKAAALILAEIERLDRADLASKAGEA